MWQGTPLSAKGPTVRPLARVLGSCLLLAVALTANAPASGRGEVRGEIDLEGFRGRVVVLHFWATWCDPCRDELASIAAFYEGPYRRLRELGVELVTVSNDVRGRDLDAFLEHQRLPFPVYVDSLGELNDQLSLSGIPATVILGRAGTVKERLYGAQEWDASDLYERIARHLEL